MFLPQVKNIFASRTQILRPKHFFPSSATMKTNGSADNTVREKTLSLVRGSLRLHEQGQEEAGV